MGTAKLIASLGPLHAFVATPLKLHSEYNITQSPSGFRSF